MKKRIKKIITIMIVSCLSFVLGLYTFHKANEGKEAILTNSGDTHLKTSEKKIAPNNTNALDVNEDDPLMHLKMLQKDVETFRALMKEVKKELFLTKT
jgi:hypothetical protein